MDYYEVRFFKDGELQDSMTMTDLFVGDVIEIIDEKVEKIEEYNQ